MKKVIVVLTFIFLPILVSAVAVNQQSTYDVPYGTDNVLILDATLSEPVQSIEIRNTGTADNTVISELMIWGDGASPGFDGDERELARIIYLPFFDRQISGDFDTRIFVTVDLRPDFIDQKTIIPQLLVGGEVEAVGFERKIRHDASNPTAPGTPIALAPEPLSSTVVRWHFRDQSNNEFGFKILDGNLNELARKEEADISYIDEIGLQPDTEYSGRQVAAFNDRGTSQTSVISIFSSARTLKASPTEEEPKEQAEEPEELPVEEVVEEEPPPQESLSEKIERLQLQLIELLKQLIDVLNQQLAKVQNFLAGLWVMFF